MKNIFLVFLCITVTTLITPAEQKDDLSSETQLNFAPITQYLTDSDSVIGAVRYHPTENLLAYSSVKNDHIGSLSFVNTLSSELTTYCTPKGAHTLNWFANKGLVIGFFEAPHIQLVNQDNVEGRPQPFHNIDLPRYELLAFSCHPTMHKLVYSGSDCTITTWDIEQAFYSPYNSREYNEPIITLAHDPTGRVVASGSRKGKMYLWDESTQEYFYTELFDSIQEKAKRVTCIKWNKSGTTLALILLTQKNTSRLLCWDARMRRTLHSMDCPSKLNDCCWNLDDSYVTSASDDGVVRLWDTNTNKCTAASLVLNNGAVAALDWSSVTDQLAVGDSDGKVSILKLSKENTDDFYPDQPEGENQ